MKKNGFFIVLLLTNILLAGQDQSLRLINQKSAGLLLEYGLPYYDLPEGVRYHPLMMGATFNLPTYKTSNFINISVDIFPHFVYAWCSNNCYLEFGLNVRLGFNFEVSINDILGAKIGSGPHYVNVETEKQASGFIFSDYYLLFYKRSFCIVKQRFAFELESGYRHISNAGIKMPNRSISNFIFGFGISKVF